MTPRPTVAITVNGRHDERVVEPRLSLADLLRDELKLTGTHVGCEQGVCGACTVLVDGVSVRSCLMLAAQADGSEIRTVEGLAGADGSLGDLQQAFIDNDALQCGFCTPGFLLTATELLEQPALSEPDLREALSGNLCRCTAYDGIVRAVTQTRATRPAPVPTETSAFEDLSGIDLPHLTVSRPPAPEPAAATRTGRSPVVLAAAAGVALAVAAATARRLLRR
jgi:aerobic-type carbon monoxide dehydrogenase small subunit (CoxS/CutS family)